MHGCKRIQNGSAVAALALLSAHFLWVSAAEGVATAENWPMFRGNPGLTGLSPAKLPENPKLLWTYKTGGPVLSSAAIVGGRVYVGSDDKMLHCIDAADGHKIWTFPTEAEVQSSPLVLDGLVYFGSSDGGLYAVDAQTGKQAWVAKTGDKILGAPNWVEAPQGNAKWILAGSYDYNLYCLDAKTGHTNWTFETGNYINGTPAIDNGKTVFGGCDALLHVVSLEKGQKIKEVDAGAYIAGSGAFKNHRFYIGHYENEFLCADIQAGEIVWRFKDRAFPYFSSPALTDERVIFGGRDKKLHCLKKENGQEIWSFATRGKVDSSPVVCGDKVVVGSEDGRLYMVRVSDGTPVWNYEIGQGISGSPSVVDNLIVIGSQDGNVYAFGRK